MIKLQRAIKPTFLTDAKVAELTSEFKANATNVWNIDAIKIPLLLSSNSKCAYCECSLSRDSNYMEVEHFEDKSNNPDKVVEWTNLLPSCKTCNGAKSTHDVIKEPIVNPYVDDPKAHLAIRLYRIRAKTDIGKITIEVTNMNDSKRHVESRYLIGQKIHLLIETAAERLSKYISNPVTRTRNKIISTVEGLLTECQPTANYAASTATIVLSDPEFTKLVTAMQNQNIWTTDLDSLMNNASLLVLDSI